MEKLDKMLTSDKVVNGIMADIVKIDEDAIKAKLRSLVHRLGYASLTPAEAQKEFEALPDTKLSDSDIDSIIAQVRAKTTLEAAIAKAENK